MNAGAIASSAPPTKMTGLRHAPRWAAALALLPLPIWFLIALVRDPGPAWRAEYHGNLELSGAATIVAERQVSRYWDRHNKIVPGGLNARSFSALWDTCLKLETARDVPFMLVANGMARFEIDGEEKLVAAGEKQRRTSGAVLRLEPGMHHLRVIFSARGWPSVALNASFDGQAPVPLSSEVKAPGVELIHPATGNPPCSSPR